jgi:hypothetical protein
MFGRLSTICKRLAGPTRVLKGWWESGRGYHLMASIELIMFIGMFFTISLLFHSDLRKDIFPRQIVGKE